MEDEIWATKARFVAALERGDAEAAALTYADDARLLPPSTQLLEGRYAIQAFWQAGLDAGVSAVVLETLALERHDGLAYEIGRYALRLDPREGAAVVDHGKYVLIHERQEDGAWRFAAEMFNPDSPPLPAVERDGGGTP